MPPPPDRLPLDWGPPVFTEGAAEAVTTQHGHVGLALVMRDDRFVLSWTIGLGGEGATLPQAEWVLRDVAELIEEYADGL